MHSASPSPTTSASSPSRKSTIPENPSPLAYVTNADDLNASFEAETTPTESAEVEDKHDERADSVASADDTTAIADAKAADAPKPKRQKKVKSSLRESTPPQSLPAKRKRRRTVKAVQFDAARNEENVRAESIADADPDLRQWFGHDQLPRRNGKLREMAKLQAEKETLVQSQFGKPLPPQPPFRTVTFVDSYTKIEFGVLRSELKGDVLEAVEEGGRENPDEEPRFYFETATPMALWMYVCYNRFGAIRKTYYYGWSELVKTYPMLAKDSYMSGLLAALSMAITYEDPGFMQCVIDAVDERVRWSLVTCGE